MTVSVQTPFTAAEANGSTTVFPYQFKINDEDDLEVTLDGVIQTTGFTVSGVGDNIGGNVTFSVAPAAGVAVLLARNPILDRDTDYAQFGKLPSAVLDSDLDRIWLALQKFANDFKRSLKLPVTTLTDQVLDYTAIERANTVIGFDAAGELLAMPVHTSTSLVDLAASSGSSLVGFIQSGTGAVARTVQSKGRDSVSVMDFGAVGDGVTDDSAAIQAAIDAVLSAGGGRVHVPAGSYVIGTSLKPKTGVLISGDGYGTQLIQKAANLWETTTLTTVTRCCIENFRHTYAHATPAQTHAAMMLRSHSYCVFQNLWFDGYATSTGAGANDGQTIIKVMPDSTAAGLDAKNFVLNSIRNIYVDACRIGVYVEGKDNSSTPATTHTGGSYSVSNAVSGNTWDNIVLRAVYYKGLEVKQWADSEAFYSFWAQAWEEGVTLIDLNTDATNFWQVDRFTFIRPVLTYQDSQITDGTLVTGIRLGPGTLMHYFYNVITDKVWDADKASPVVSPAFFVDDSSTSYWMSMASTGEGTNRYSCIHHKGMKSTNQGTATIAATTTSITVAHNMRRAPTGGEIQVTPLSNLEVGSVSRSFWVSTVGATNFVINISSAYASADLNFAWRVELGTY
jgi:hypothetical protein